MTSNRAKRSDVNRRMEDLGTPKVLEACSAQKSANTLVSAPILWRFGVSFPPLQRAPITQLASIATSLTSLPKMDFFLFSLAPHPPGACPCTQTVQVLRTRETSCAVRALARFVASDSSKPHDPPHAPPLSHLQCHVKVKLDEPVCDRNSALWQRVSSCGMLWKLEAALHDSQRNAPL